MELRYGVWLKMRGAAGSHLSWLKRKGALATREEAELEPERLNKTMIHRPGRASFQYSVREMIK
jgi:hypothetical protein